MDRTIDSNVIPDFHKLACSNCVDSHLSGEVRLELSLPSRSAEAVGRARESDRDRGGVTAGVTVMDGGSRPCWTASSTVSSRCTPFPTSSLFVYNHH